VHICPAVFQTRPGEVRRTIVLFPPLWISLLPIGLSAASSSSAASAALQRELPRYSHLAGEKDCVDAEPWDECVYVEEAPVLSVLAMTMCYNSLSHTEVAMFASQVNEPSLGAQTLGALQAKNTSIRDTW